MNKTVILAPIGVFAAGVLLFGNHSADTTRIDAYARNSQSYPGMYAKPPVDLYSGPYALDNSPVPLDDPTQYPPPVVPTTKAKAPKSSKLTLPHLNVPHVPLPLPRVTARGHVRIR